MPNVERPAITLVDTEKVLASISAVDQGGAKLPSDQFEWASSDGNVVLVETADDPYTRWLRTPNPGVAVVTVTHTPTGNTETMEVTVTFSSPGEIGLSVGTPVPE